MPSHEDIVLLANAYHGRNNNPDQTRIAITAIELIALLLRKNTDYGRSIFEGSRLLPESPAKARILLRLEDKIARLEQLSRSDARVPAETLRDTMRDLVGYGILWLTADAIDTEVAARRSDND